MLIKYNDYRLILGAGIESIYHITCPLNKQELVFWWVAGEHPLGKPMGIVLEEIKKHEETYHKEDNEGDAKVR